MKADWKKKYKIAIIGAGRIAHSLAPALIKNGFTVNSVFSSSFKSAKILADQNKNISAHTLLEEAVGHSNIIFIAVPDSQIGIIAGEISKIPGIKGKIFIHLSGALTIKVLSVLKKKGAVTAGLHIISAFPERKKTSIENFYASVETGDKITDSLIKNLASAIGLKPFNIADDEKIILHIMCVFVSNFIVADYFNAFRLYKKIKSKIPPMEELLPPLSAANLNYIKKNGIAGALSGPVARKDYETVNRHLEKLTRLSGKDKKFSDVLESYAIQTLNLMLMEKEFKMKSRS